MQKKSLEKIQASTGFKCMASRYKFATATNWATKPHIGGEAHLEVSFFLKRNFIIIFIENFDPKKWVPWPQRLNLQYGAQSEVKLHSAYHKTTTKTTKSISGHLFNNKKKKKKEHTHINQCLEKSIVIILQEMVCRLQW